MKESVNRREFMKGAAGAGATLGLAAPLRAARRAAVSPGRVLGANDRINVAVFGLRRGAYLAGVFAEIGRNTNGCHVAAVCDVWQKRLRENMEKFRCEGSLDYREILNRSDIDAVVVATPDHWHAQMAIEAMERGKDVYVEKPMTHTLAEAKALVETVKKTRRVLQVGSQTTSGDQWHKAKQAIADGMIGTMIMSQGSYHRNSVQGEWNYEIDRDAGPQGKGDNYIDWNMWLGPAPKRPWDPERFFRFQKFWDYSGGIPTDLFYHVVAPMNICWGEAQFPYRVMGGGGIHVFKDRETPDTFHLIGEYSKGHSIVLSSSMANSQHIPGLIRGHEGSLIMVEHGRFEGYAPFITVRPEKRVISADYKARWGEDDIRIPVREVNTLATHITNFLECMRSRRKPTLDVETGARAQVLITLAVQSYREGRVLYFDEKNWKAVAKPPKAV